jgi:hypothetical protein
MIEHGMEKHGVELRIAKGQGRHVSPDKFRIFQTGRHGHVTGRPYRSGMDVDARHRFGGFRQCGRDGPWTTADVDDAHCVAAELSPRLRWKSRMALLCLTGRRTIPQWGWGAIIDQAKAPVLTGRAGAFEF